MGGDRPKQFLELCGIPIIIHALKQFEQCRAIDQIIVVVPPGEAEGLSALVARFGRHRIMLVFGILRACWPVGLAFVGRGTGGLILVDRKGDVGYAFSLLRSPDGSHYVDLDGHSALLARLAADGARGY